ncbi:MAG: efflux RND transporter permease subunit [Vulcanimicrobiota bacterium]
MFEFAVKRPVSVIIIILAMIGLGIYFSNNINVELFPKLDIPMVSVTTLYPGAGPEEVEEQVTRPLEESLGTVGNLKKISSTSQENVSMVMLEFEYGTNMTETTADVREKVDGAKMRLPEDAESPVVTKADPSASPVMRLTFSGNMDLRSMRTIADNDIKKDLEKIDGVAMVTVLGGYEREILVAVDPVKLKKYSLTPQNILNAVQMENVNVPGGRITTNNLEFQIRTVGQFKTPDELKGIYVGKSGDRKLYLRDVAEVKDTYKEPRSISRVNGVSCVSFQIRRNSDANVVKVCEKIRKSLPDTERLIPQGTKLEIIYDESIFVKQSIHAMQEEALEAGILAVLVIFIFLGSLRSTVIIALSMPSTVMAAFIFMYFDNITINMITLGAFIMAIGRVVDDSIVILENIFRYVEEGHTPFDAAIKGAKEVGLAVMASTFTTCAVFSPLLIIAGVAGQIFGPLSKVFMANLLFSMIVAILLVPMMAARLIKIDHASKDDTEKKKTVWLKIYLWWNGIFKRIEDFYRTALGWSLSHRFIILATSGILFLVSLVVFAKVPKEMQPKIDRGRTSFSIETPIGSSLYKTNEILKSLEEFVMKNIPEKEHLITDVGMSPSGQQSMAGSGSEEPRMGGISIYLVEKKHRKKTVFDIEDLLRANFTNVPGAAFRVGQGMSLTGEAALQIIIKGEDIDTLGKLGEKYNRIISAIPGATDIDLNWKSGNPEYKIVVDRVKAAEAGVNVAEVASTVRYFVRGEEVADISRFKEKGKEYDITIRLPEDKRGNIEDIQNLPIEIDKEVQIPLWSIASTTLAGAPSKVTRQDRVRCIIVQGNIAGRATQLVMDDIRAAMIKNPPPPGYTWEIGGEEKRREEVFTQLFTSLALAIFLVYAILAIQFESFIHPLTIMLAVPLQMIGVSLALIIFAIPVSMMVLLGLIMLTGIVVSNSILLVNYIIVLREQHNMKKKDAILKAGPTRLRPILMTATATMIAMIPMAMGVREGGEFYIPLAKVVMGGLLTSTVFTLLVIPAAYSLIDDIGMKFGLAKKE